MVEDQQDELVDGSPAANLSTQPSIQPSARRSTRPVRQASLGVQMAVGKAKAEIYDDEIASVPVLPRAKKIGYSVPPQGQPVPPALPEPGPEQQAYHSWNLDTSQSLGGHGGSPRYARSSDYEPSVQHMGPGGIGRVDYSDRSIESNSQPDYFSRHNILDALAAAAASSRVQQEQQLQHHHQEQQQKAVAAAAAAVAATAAGPTLPNGSVLSDMDPTFVKSLLQRAICELSNLVNNPHPSQTNYDPQPLPVQAPAPVPMEAQAPMAGRFGGSVPNNGGFSKWSPRSNTYSHISPFHYQPSASEWASRSSH